MTPGLPSASTRLVTLPLRRPRTIVAALVLVTLLSLLAWPGVRFEPDVSHLLPGDHPHLRVARLLDEQVRPARSLWVLLRGADLETAVPVLAADLRTSPLVSAVAITRAELFAMWSQGAEQAPLWYLPGPALDRLQASLGPAGRVAAIENLRSDLADDPIAAHELAVRDPLGLRWTLADADPARAFGLQPGTDLAIFADGRQALLRITGTSDAYDAEYATALLEHVERVLARADYDAFGGYTVARSDQARIRGDLQRSGVWSMLLIALYLVWVMRGLRMPLLVQLPAALSIAWAIPFGSLWFGPLPTVAVAAVAMLCGLGVDFAIHYAARYREERLRFDHREAVRRVQVATVPELLIDMATTAVTFLAVGSGTLSGLRSFGFLLALGLACSFLVTITALPILLARAGERADPERSWIATLADRWLASRAARPVAWLGLAAAVVVVVLVAARGVSVSADPDLLRPADDPVAASRMRIEQQLGFSTVPVALLWPLAAEPTPLWRGLLALENAGDVRFWSGLQAQETIERRSAVAGFRAATADFVDATSADLRRAGLEPEAFQPALVDLGARLAADPPPARPVVAELDGVMWRVVSVWPTQRIGAANLAAFADRVHRELGSEVLIHGGAALQRDLEQVLRSDLHRACWWAAALAVLMVTVWLRSLRLGLLALLPSAIALATTLALLVAVGMPLSLVSFVAVPFVLGIGVDEGVHMVGHFRRGASTTGATGVGVVRTSLGTVLGFGALLAADSPGLRALGGIVAVGSLAGMLGCMFVLAPLLARQPSRHQSRAQQNQ